MAVETAVVNESTIVRIQFFDDQPPDHTGAIPTIPITITSVNLQNDDLLAVLEHGARNWAREVMAVEPGLVQIGSGDGMIFLLCRGIDRIAFLLHRASLSHYLQLAADEDADKRSVLDPALTGAVVA